MEKTKWGIYEHWYGTAERPICKRCYVRGKWHEKYVPKNTKCKKCGELTKAVSKYGIPLWVRDRETEGLFYCKACFLIVRDTGKERPEMARKNIGDGIQLAL